MVLVGWRIHLVWMKRPQNLAFAVRHWTSLSETILECFNTNRNSCILQSPSTFCHYKNMNVIVKKQYLQYGLSFVSLRSVSGGSLFSSLLISLLISRCWRSRASSLAVRSSQDLERGSGWPCDKPRWFNMPSEHDMRLRFRLRAW